MIALEAKLSGTDEQYLIIEEMIRTARFIQNSCLRYWMDNRGVGQYDLSKLCAELAIMVLVGREVELDGSSG